MITPEWLSSRLDLMSVADELTSSVIEDIARRIVKMGRLTDTAAWQSEMLQQSGVLYDEIIKRVADSASMLEDEIKAFYEDAQAEVLNYDEVSVRKAGFDSDEFRRLSPEMINIFAAQAQKTCTDAANITKTTAITSQTAFISACDLAAMQVSSGAFSYNQAITNAIKSASAQGGYVLYESGKRDRLDVAVRRAVLTGVNQTGGQVVKMQAERFGMDIMELSAHVGARPEHAEWQGKLVSLSGESADGDEILTLDDIGYGEVTGFQGANCRHTWFPYFGFGRVYSDEQLQDMADAETEYNGEKLPVWKANGMLRGMERKIRDTKRELIALDVSSKSADGEELVQNLKTEFAAKSVKLKTLEKKMKDFCSQTGITFDSSRVQNVGFGKSISQKSVKINKKELAKYSKLLYNEDGTLYVTDNRINLKHPKIPRQYKPFAVIETKSFHGSKSQFDRTIYDEKGIMSVQYHGGGHAEKENIGRGIKGEHKHLYTFADNKNTGRVKADWNKEDYLRNGDLLK